MQYKINEELLSREITVTNSCLVHLNIQIFCYMCFKLSVICMQSQLYVSWESKYQEEKEWMFFLKHFVKNRLWSISYEIFSFAFCSIQASTKADPPKPANQEEEEEVDIDLGDPDVQSAALKIQAGFRGIKARKGVKDVKGKESKPGSS